MNILIVSNMFPTKQNPSYGIFVKKFCDELEQLGVSYDKSVMTRKKGKIGKMLNYVHFYLMTVIRLLLFKYDVVYVHYASHSSAPVLFVNRFRKLHVFTNVHGSDVVPENDRQKKMQKYTGEILGISKKIIVPSTYFKNYVREKYGIQESKIYVYPSGGIDSSTFFEMDFEKKVKLKKDFEFEENIPVFGMAGRISSGKGWDTFLRAIEILKQRKIVAKYVVVGDGIEKNKFESLMKELKIEKNVTLFGLLPQDKLAEYYNAIDFFVFPTKREGESLGLVAVEAMACGTPVIASDFAAPKDYVKDQDNGFKFEVDDEYGLASCIEKCCALYKSEEYFQLCQGAKKTSEAYYSENVREKLKKIFETL